MTFSNNTGYDGQGFVPAPANMKVDKNLVKRLVGEAAEETDGVLGLKGGLMDIFKRRDDPSRGVTIHIEDNRAVARMRMVAEAGKNLPTVVNEVTGRVVNALQNTMGLDTERVVVDVVDIERATDYLVRNYPDATRS